MPEPVDDYQIAANDPLGLVVHQVLDEMSPRIFGQRVEGSEESPKEIDENLKLHRFLAANSQEQDEHIELPTFDPEGNLAVSIALQSPIAIADFIASHLVAYLKGDGHYIVAHCIVELLPYDSTMVASVEDQSPKVNILLLATEGGTSQLERAYVFDPGGNYSGVTNKQCFRRLSLGAIAVGFLSILEDKDPLKRKHCDGAAKTESRTEMAFVEDLGMNIAQFGFSAELQEAWVLCVFYFRKGKISWGYRATAHVCVETLTLNLMGECYKQAKVKMSTFISIWLAYFTFLACDFQRSKDDKDESLEKLKRACYPRNATVLIPSQHCIYISNCSFTVGSAA